MSTSTWLTTPEAGRRLGITAGDVVDLIFDGELPGRPAPDYSRLMVRESDLEEYLRRHPEVAAN